MSLEGNAPTSTNNGVSEQAEAPSNSVSGEESNTEKKIALTTEEMEELRNEFFKKGYAKANEKIRSKTGLETTEEIITTVQEWKEEKQAKEIQQEVENTEKTELVQRLQKQEEQLKDLQKQNERSKAFQDQFKTSQIKMAAKKSGALDEALDVLTTVANDRVVLDEEFNISVTSSDGSNSLSLDDLMKELSETHSYMFQPSNKSGGGSLPQKPQSSNNNSNSKKGYTFQERLNILSNG